MNQERYFREVGGDEYFRRNEDSMRRATRNHPLVQLALKHVELDRAEVVVIGGGSGSEAAEVKLERPRWEVINVDISEMAISAGNEFFPDVHHIQASVCEPSLVNAIGGPVDLVLVTGLLLWVDRGLLLSAVANIDMLVREEGFLGIHDFLVPEPMKVAFEHAPGVFTYKQAYRSIFLTTCLYQSVDSKFHITGPTSLGDDNRVVSADLLIKRRTYRDFPPLHSGKCGLPSDELGH